MSTAESYHRTRLRRNLRVQGKKELVTQVFSGKKKKSGERWDPCPAKTRGEAVRPQPGKQQKKRAGKKKLPAGHIHITQKHAKTHRQAESLKSETAGCAQNLKGKPTYSVTCSQELGKHQMKNSLGKNGSKGDNRSRPGKVSAASDKAGAPVRLRAAGKKNEVRKGRVDSGAQVQKKTAILSKPQA